MFKHFATDNFDNLLLVLLHYLLLDLQLIPIITEYCGGGCRFHHQFIFAPAQRILHCGPLPPRPTPEAAAAEEVAADTLPKLWSQMDP